MLPRRYALPLLLLLVAATAVLSLMPIDSLPIERPLGKVAEHGLGFAALGFLAMSLAVGWSRLVLLMVLFGFGLLIEAFQIAIPGRTGLPSDVFVNGLGLLAGAALALLIARWRQGRWG